MRDLIAQFREAICSANLVPPDIILDDGKLHRFASNGKNGDDAGWYVFHGDGVPAGSFGDWRTGRSQSWRADVGRQLTPIEEATHRVRVDAIRQKRKAEEEQRHKEAATKAAAILGATTPATNDHPYLKRKGIQAHGARLHRDALVIPMRDAEGTLRSLQFIGADGHKLVLAGGRVSGCYFSIGKPNDCICIAEGFATGASVHEATGNAVAIAFNWGNLLAVAQAIRAKYPTAKLILCADDDVKTVGNPGLTAATTAARSVNGMVAIPDFGADRPDDATDFNDMAGMFGLGAVGHAVHHAKQPDASTQQAATTDVTASTLEGGDWPKPLPLIATVAPEPYPLDALPDSIRAAVEEVTAFVKSPVPLVASSALTALSLAAQAHVDVQRDAILFGPASLFILSIADSGERKTQADKMFAKPIQDYQDAEAEAAKPRWKNFRAGLEAWEAKRGGIKEKIRQLSRRNESSADEERALRELEDEKPEPPRVPKLIREDATPEGLAKKLQTEWPSAGVVSNEAGIVFGAHGMNRESVMRNLALLNKLWDGGRYQSDRSDEERSRDVRGARLTMGLMIQESTLRAFFDQLKGLARGTGFLARFLIAWPESTMGTRLYSPPVAGSPALSAFNDRIAQLLAQPARIDADGILTPMMLSLTPAALTAWVEFHNAIEIELGSGGELNDVRDVASKTADNAVRLAALFHLFSSRNSNGSNSNIQIAEIESATRIVAWHLNESRRFFGELALPAELADAARLDKWLISHCRSNGVQSLPKNFVRQRGPLRDGKRLDAAIRELGELDRTRLEKVKRRETILLNPALFTERIAS